MLALTFFRERKTGVKEISLIVPRRGSYRILAKRFRLLCLLHTTRPGRLDLAGDNRRRQGGVARFGHLCPVS